MYLILAKSQNQKDYFINKSIILAYMSKRGQITIIMIIGIIMLFLTLAVIFIVRNAATEDIKTKSEIIPDDTSFDPVKSYIDYCLERTAKEAVEYVSFRGGYYHVPEPTLNQVLVNIPYYFNLGQKRFPTKDLISNQMASYIEDNIDDCFQDFSSFRNQGIGVVSGKPKVEVTLGRTTIFDLHLSLELEKKDIIKGLQKFSYTLPLDFEEVYSIIEQTMLEQEKNPNFVPIGKVSSQSKEKDFKFELSYLDNNVVVYSYIFNRYFIDDEKYIFVFANRYDWRALEWKPLDYIQDLGDQRCYVGDICSFNLNMYGDPFMFEDYNELFDITSDGMIKFIPNQESVGMHEILIKISDPDGSEEIVVFKLEIIPLVEVPEIKVIPDQTAYIGQQFTYQVELERGSEAIFFAETDLFEISEDGFIDFVPNETGFHIIEIAAGNKDSEDVAWLYLTIEDEE